jgi:hypothetical protein
MYGFTLMSFALDKSRPAASRVDRGSRKTCRDPNIELWSPSNEVDKLSKKTSVPPKSRLKS